MSSSHPSESLARLEGPDYVALVIEWDDEDNAATLVRTKVPIRPPAKNRTLATLLGALGAIVTIALTTWGLHRLRVAL